jgi:hypothetical protein
MHYAGGSFTAGSLPDANDAARRLLYNRSCVGGQFASLRPLNGSPSCSRHVFTWIRTPKSLKLATRSPSLFGCTVHHAIGRRASIFASGRRNEAEGRNWSCRKTLEKRRVRLPRARSHRSGVRGCAGARARACVRVEAG